MHLPMALQPYLVAALEVWHIQFGHCAGASVSLNGLTEAVDSATAVVPRAARTGHSSSVIPPIGHDRSDIVERSDPSLPNTTSRELLNKRPSSDRRIPSRRWLVDSHRLRPWGLGHEQQEVDHRVSAESVHHVFHPVGAVLQYNLPEILTIDVTDCSLGYEYDWKPR